MDLMDFEEAELYFDEPVNPEVLRLLETAAASYGDEETEQILLKADFMAPEQLLVRVALYRYYFYQHRLDDALRVADSTLALVGGRLDFPDAWVYLREANIGAGVMISMGLVRFYLMVLKSAGYINLRLGHHDTGLAMLEKLVELDSHDRMGAKALLNVIIAANNEEIRRAR
jgi:tetratricopeptide (TPR) repeat protein